MSDHNETGAENNGDPQPFEEINADTENGGTETAPSSDKDGANPDGKHGKLIKIPLFAAVIAVLAFSVLASMITFLAVRQNYHRKLSTIARSRFSDAKLAEVDNLYRANYINEIDGEKLTDGLIRGYVYGTGDKYGAYMTAEEYDRYNSSLESKAEGIGASVIWNAGMSAIEVVSVYENSPAEAAGVEVGDLIVEADGKSIAELGFDQGVNAVRGKSGTTVKITVKRGENYEQTLQIEAERKEIELKTVTFKPLGEIAVISISNFYASTPAELRSAVNEATAAGCDRIVFDLRNNTGGLLDSVKDSLDYILPEGVIVRIVDASNNWTEYKSDASCLQMPMVVLVNGNTASAAELFASALMDYGYATVVGTQTYGKGTVLGLFKFSDGSALSISVQLYYPPKSDNFEGVGITPDEVLELSDEAKKINFSKLTYENDNQLQRAVEIIKEK